MGIESWYDLDKRVVLAKIAISLQTQGYANVAVGVVSLALESFVALCWETHYSLPEQALVYPPPMERGARFSMYPAAASDPDMPSCISHMPFRGVPLRFDHIFGNFRTEAGHVRRLDVIIAPAEEQHFCVLGWSGSRQYLRFLRQWAVDLGMHLNSHRRVSFKRVH